MATKGEQSVLSLLTGGESLAGYETELARPDLWNSPSGNYGPTAELALDLEAERSGSTALLADSASRWERHLEPGVPGVAMRIEPNSSTYVPWIVLPVDGAYHIFSRYDFGRLAAERAHWWLRAWLTVAALGMATTQGKLIDDETDPPGEARPGPVYARADVDREPWTGSPYVRGNRGILPSVLVGERAWQRAYPPSDVLADYRLCRGYLDQSQHSQIAMLALGLSWVTDGSESGDWPVRFRDGLKAWRGITRILDCITADERRNIRRAWETKSVEDVRRVMHYLDGWYFDRDLVLCAHDNGSLWMFCMAGGRTSTASTEAATFDAESLESGWLAANNGMRDASAASSDIVQTRGWEDGPMLCAERNDGRYGTRYLRKPSGRELWRINFTRTANLLSVAGQPVDSPAPALPAPSPEPTPTPQPPAAGDAPEIIPHEGGWLVLWRGEAEVLGWPSDDGRTMVVLK